MSNIPLDLTRDLLQGITANPRALRALEDMLRQVSTDIPANIEAVSIEASSATSLAASASAAADAADRKSKSNQALIWLSTQ